MLDFFKLKKQPLLQIDPGTPVTEARYVVIDTELTGLNERKDSIISIGALRMTGSRIEIGSTFHHLINPERKFTPESVVIHGITPSDVEEKPSIDHILEEFLRFCNDDILVGHCISIDLSFINREIKRVSGGTIQNPAIDTFRVYEWLRKKVASKSCFSSQPKDPGLYEMAKCFDISVQGAHDALMDSFITAQLFQRFIPLLHDTGITQLGDLLTLGNPAEGGDKFKQSGEIANF